MVVFISGATHTGKTRLAQKLLERHGWPYLSLDHLKMGLIRSGYTSLTVEDEDELTALMWPIVREMAKTAIENDQHLIVEGCYLPYDLLRDNALTIEMCREHGCEIILVDQIYDVELTIP